MENNSQSKNKILNIIFGIGRYFLGIIILLSPMIVTLIKGVSLSFVLLGILTPPITFIVAPPILIGLYFMITGKTRIRLDFTLLLLAVICIIALFSFK
jgi:hypothetical protein